MSKIIENLFSTSIGRAAYKTVQPVVYLARHMAHPNVPRDRTVSKVNCRGKQFLIQRRRGSESDYEVIDQCFKLNQYDMPNGAHGIFIDRIYREILASGRQPLIVDCGSNIGCSVLWFHARYPEAHIVAIEPAPDNFELLSANCAGLDADLRQAGVAANDGQAYLSDQRGSGMAYHTTTEGSGPAVSMVSIQTLLANKPASHYVPFLLKIDIEGAEKSLFEDASSALNEFPLIVMEPHDWLLPGQLSSQPFFRFHTNAGREFCMKHENIASIALDSRFIKDNHLGS